MVEGLTEFLPISSTFHLLFATRFLGLAETEFVKFFDVFIQAGAILPVVLIYFREWIRDRVILQKVAVSFVPTAVVGLILHKVIKDVFFASPLLMISAFVLMGVVFFLLEALVKKGEFRLEKPIAQMSYMEAFVIGCVQALAVVPGVSRAGAVIVGMMFFKFKREEAAKYSFILAVPTILAAAALDVLKSKTAVLAATQNDLLALAIGTVAAFVSSLLIIRWFISYLRKNSLNVFGAYRLVVSGVLMVLGMWR
jgi:undecaprenyl-diphosphatase